MSTDPGVIIARRSLSLSLTYVIVGIFLALVSVVISSVPSLLSTFPSTGGPPNFNGLDASTYFRLLTVPFQVIAAIAFTTPVLLLYVYDKNNGVLEYFLSLGMDRSDIYKRYLKAALLLALALATLEIVLNLIVGLLEGSNIFFLLGVAGLVILIALSVVSFTTMVMMAFSSLQKQRVGSNQPLGIALGVFMVMPAYIGPLVFPDLAIPIDVIVALVAIALTTMMFFLSSKLISREKLLP